jgi:hypothetical protein
MILKGVGELNENVYITPLTTSIRSVFSFFIKFIFPIFFIKFINFFFFVGGRGVI